MTTPPAAEGPQVTGQGLPGAVGGFQQTSPWGPSELLRCSGLMAPRGTACTRALHLRGSEIVASHFTDTEVSVCPKPGKGCGPKGS